MRRIESSTVGVAGQRCALNLAGVEKAQVERGMWVQAPSLANMTERFDATLTLSPRVAKSLGNSSTVHLHHGTDDAMAKVAVLDATRIEPGESQLVSLTLDRPLAVCRGDRFVIRDASAQRTLGGGTVLDVMPLGSAARRGRRAPARLQLLAALRDGSPVDALRAWLDREPVALSRIASGWNLRDDELRELIDASGAHVAANVAISAEHWQRLRSEVVAAIGLAHEKEPEMPGVEQQRLRRMIAPALDIDVFGSLIDELLEQSSLQRRGAFLALPTHTATLGKDQRVRWERIKPLLDDRKFDPPRVRDIARDTGIPEVEVRHLLKTVARTGDVAQVAHDHFFLTTRCGRTRRHRRQRRRAPRRRARRRISRPNCDRPQACDPDSRIFRPGRLPAQGARRSLGQTSKSMARLRFFANITDPEECRVPVGRPDFKSGRGCQQSLVGSTPILFRQNTLCVFWRNGACAPPRGSQRGAQAPAPPGKFILALRPARSAGPLVLPEPV